MFNIKFNILFLCLIVAIVKCNSDKEDEEVTFIPILPNNEEDINDNNIAPEEYLNAEVPNYKDILVGMNQTLNNTKLISDSTVSSNGTNKYVECIPETEKSFQVHLVNDTELLQILIPNANITSRHTPAHCVIVLFYSKYCPFSSMAAPHFNALARAFPYLKFVAINAMLYHVFNAQHGILGVPTLAFFHNGRLINKFNDSEYTLELFSKFIRQTAINPEEKSYVTSADFSGPVSSLPYKETDYLLGLSWMFMLVCAVYYFVRSKYWRFIVETVQNTWRESEAQALHEHND